MKQNSMLAMILAGGRGTRLHELTTKVAKPAVSYGGKYRIIDFPLSNCANSGIDTVGVLTQYESILLNSYVAAGRRWGLDAKNSGVYVLPPREKADANLDVYRGTADAISQNIDFIDTFFSGVSPDPFRRPHLQDELCKDAGLPQRMQCRRDHRRNRSSIKRSQPFRYHEYRRNRTHLRI